MVLAFEHRKYLQSTTEIFVYETKTELPRGSYNFVQHIEITIYAIPACESSGETCNILSEANWPR